MLKRKKPFFYRERRNPLPVFLAVLVGITAAGFWLLQYPTVQQRLGWRMDAAMTTVRTWINPIGGLPTPNREFSTLSAPPFVLAPVISPTATPAGNSQAAPTPTQIPALPAATPTPIPSQVSLKAPEYELQDWNNCGPASLTLYLRFYGWEGDQFDISDQIKPVRADRNVNIDELTGFVSTNLPELRALFRVGGDLDLLRSFIAAGMPIMIEETFYLEENFWYNDDRWSGHYQLLTGYDDAARQFITQDSFVGPNKRVSYDTLDEHWQSFNRAYLVVYPLELETDVYALLGSNWDPETNRMHALETAQAETKKDRGNVYAWFNLGSNLTYFSRYEEAAAAYDTARDLGWPQRMLRYQFGPFLAYFHTGRNDDLLSLTKYALEVTPNSEEALLWRGWAQYRAGQRQDAVNQFNKALEARPGYADAVYGLNYVASN